MIEKIAFGIEGHNLPIVFPEEFLIDLENHIIKKYGEKGKQVLYSAGKKFGYRYSKVSLYPTIRNSSIKNVKDFIYMFLRYMEATYAAELNYKIYDEKIYEMTMKDYVVCSENGHGYILTDGGTAGPGG